MLYQCPAEGDCQPDEWHAQPCNIVTAQLNSLCFARIDSGTAAKRANKTDACYMLLHFRDVSEHHPVARLFVAQPPVTHVTLRMFHMDPYDELKWEIEKQAGVKVGHVLRSFADKQKEYGDDEPDYWCTRVRVGLTLCLTGEEDETTLEYRYEGSDSSSESLSEDSDFTEDSD